MTKKNIPSNKWNIFCTSYTDEHEKGSIAHSKYPREIRPKLHQSN